MTKVKRPSRTAPWSRTIFGQPYSKANSRKLALVEGAIRFIKSNNAQRYVEDFAKQCPALHPLFEGDVHVEIDIYYASARPDLDESLILDALQMRVYRNDRQVKRKTVEGWIDRDNPRAVIRVSALEERVGAERPRLVRHRSGSEGTRHRMDRFP